MPSKRVSSGSVPVESDESSPGRLPEPPRTVQFHITGTCLQRTNSENLKRLENHPVVVWVELPGFDALCGHEGYRLVGVSHEGVRITNKNEFPYVCDHMGHVIE